MRTSSPRQKSPADTITQAIIERLEAGTPPWIRPWSAAGAARPLRACGTPYRGINTLWLWMAAEAAGHASPFWLTYRQAQLLDAHVRKGERGTVAIFYKAYSKEVEDRETGFVQDEARRVLKSYTVFNACQIDDLPERFFPPARPLLKPSERDVALDLFFGSIPAQLRHAGDEAYYEPAVDRITMPDRSAFADLDHYRATLAHELTHWTGHGTRLARCLAGRFGSDAYAVEELIAELSSAMLGAELGLPVAHLDHHASYAAAWLKVLKRDNRAILTAAAKAEEACNLLLMLGGRTGRNEEVAEERLLYTAPERVSEIALQPGETLIAVAAGDTARWVIGDTTSGAGAARRTHILVKPSAVGLRTNLVVTTDRRVYHVQLESTSRTAMASISWTYPEGELLALRAESSAGPDQPIAVGASVEALNFDYSIEGDDPPWRPLRAFDDGSQVFIEFPASLGQNEAPPLFVRGEGGRTELVNYRVRGRFYVVDRLFAAAELRLGERRQQVVRIVRHGGQGRRGRS